MNESNVQDLLAAHADQLIGIGSSEGHILPAAGGQELADLMELATRIKRALVPRQLPETARKKLGSALTYAASLRGEDEVRITPNRSQAEVLLGAATVALAGGILYLAHNYLQGRSQTAGQVRS